MVTLGTMLSTKLACNNVCLMASLEIDILAVQLVDNGHPSLGPCLCRGGLDPLGPVIMHII